MKKKFEEVQLFLASMSLQQSQLTTGFLLNRTKFTSAIYNLQANMAFLNLLISGLNEKRKEKQEEINKQINELNKYRKELKEINDEWEEVKDLIPIFKNYSGSLKNAICRNSQLKNSSISEKYFKIDCEKEEENSSSKKE
ncbi:hypothetical protein MSUIS_06090 [Mycoplasma suis KI3806]|uniref:Uncharacterized protein n=1 Tax=Mycoplasma suis (strain KI_3806) TaxID=708248 RepID=F0V221_MYCS3|nr:hypothetical protein [Mycoplasma suis]CBZ40702.1 hypothetical protein MSUIS_06090 [Mycoplasma suis KI3806]